MTSCGEVGPVQTNPWQPQALGCSPATPSRLGPKDPRVTNANHENRQYAQVLKVACSLILNLTQIHTLILQVESPLTKRGWERVRSAQKIATKSVESAASKRGGLGLFIANLKN
jgi:hypothetical protein